MHGFREEVGTGTVGQKEHNSGCMGSLLTGVVCEGCKRKGWGADAAVGAKGAHLTASNILALPHPVSVLAPSCCRTSTSCQARAWLPLTRAEVCGLARCSAALLCFDLLSGMHAPSMLHLQGESWPLGWPAAGNRHLGICSSTLEGWTRPRHAIRPDHAQQLCQSQAC